MKSYREIQNSLSKEINELRELGVSLKATHEKINTAIIFGVIIIAASTTLGILVDGSFFLGYFLLPSLTFMYKSSFVDQERTFRTHFKNKFLPKFVNEIQEGIQYSMTRKIPLNIILQSQTISRCDFINAEDHFRGVIERVPFEFSEIKYGYYHENDEGELTKRLLETGVFFYAAFPKDFHQRTFIQSSSVKDRSIFEAKHHNHARLERFEDPEFEKLFDVYSDDPVEARYLISTSLMSHLVDLRNKTGVKFRVSFIHKHMHIMFPVSSRNLFEVDYKRIQKLDEQLQNNYYQITNLLGVITDLKLNRKIWTKQ